VGVLPGVADVERLGSCFDGVACGNGAVGLLIELLRYEGYGAAGDKLADEDYAAATGAVRLGAYDVKTEVDLFKARVEGDWEALKADAVEEEADERDVAAVLVKIEFEAGGKPRRDSRGCDFVLRHDELAPFGCEEGGHARCQDTLACVIAKWRMEADN